MGSRIMTNVGPSQTSLPMHLHSTYGPLDADIEIILPVQTPWVRIESRERPLETILRDLIPIPAFTRSSLESSSSLRECSVLVYLSQAELEARIQRSVLSAGKLSPTRGALYFYNAEQLNLSKSLSFLNQSLGTITSDTSLAPFDRDDLSEMLEITSVLKVFHTFTQLLWVSPSFSVHHTSTPKA
ncbi:hypothetical protein BDR06DRAFT_499760 [Suillus hirtellus]|nr:hypothetical protein BDR06DRAFT_499760 [Suillus hirtellus]